MHCHNIDIAAITESHLDSTTESDDSSLHIHGYSMYRHDNPADSKKGGVLIYYRDSLPIKRRLDLEFPESIVCEMKMRRKTIIFAVVYRSPIQTSAELENFLCSIQGLVYATNLNRNKTLILTGDFNARCNSWWKLDASNHAGESLKLATECLGLRQLISCATHITNRSASCIDLIFTSQPNIFADSGVHPSLHPSCRHDIIYGNLDLEVPSAPKYTRRVWHYCRADEHSMKASLNSINWDREFDINYTDVCRQAKFLSEVVSSIAHNFIPNEVVVFKPGDPPWMNRQLRKEFNRLDKFHKKTRRKGFLPDDMTKLNDMKQNVVKLTNLCKSAFQARMGSVLAQGLSNSSKYWITLKKFLNNDSNTMVPPLIENDMFIADSHEKAELFNNFFADQCTPISTTSELPEFTLLSENLLTDVNFTRETILNIVRALNPKKAHGWDEVSVRIVKLLDESLATPLYLLFRNCLETGIFPSIWKQANVVPIHEKDDKSMKTNYRPISLLPVFGKIFEKLVYDVLYEHLISQNLLSEKQSGFRKGDSCVNQLLSITHKIYAAFDQDPALDVRSVFLDISKAFDKVWHAGPLFKLKRCGISGSLFNLMESYVCERYQRVTLNGSTSSWKLVKAGVPQGSVLGPLLFLVYINDLLDYLRCDARLFADDVSLFSTVFDAQKSYEDLSHDLNSIELWAFQWKMAFNPDPNKQAIEVIFSTKRSPPFYRPLVFNTLIVSRAAEVRHLGLTLDKNLSFSSHIKKNISKVTKTAGLIRGLRKFLPRESLILIYKSFVRPSIDYGDVIYHSPNSLLNKLESAQYQVALAITGAWKGSSAAKLYDDLGWETLADRRCCRRLFLFWKIQRKLVPSYLSSIVQYSYSTYNLRGNGKLKNIYCRTNKFKNSFFPSAISHWMHLDNSLRNMKVYIPFKTALTQIIRPSGKSTFNIHHPTGLRLLTQLRLGLSDLSAHKYLHNFVDSNDPSCRICFDGIEDTTHFLLECKAFVSFRTTLINTVSELLGIHMLDLIDEQRCKILLYGHCDRSDAINKKTLLASIQFIVETNRLS